MYGRQSGSYFWADAITWPETALEEVTNRGRVTADNGGITGRRGAIRNREKAPWTNDQRAENL